MDKQKQGALSLNDAAVKYAMLQREVDTNRELMNNMLQKMKDVAVEAESEASNVSILDAAEVPSAPSAPKRLAIVLNGTLFGVAVSLLLVVGLEFWANTLNTPEEVSRLLRLPSLGVIPEFSGGEKREG